MKAKVVSLEELTKNNPTFCLSPLRVFGECYKCPKFRFNKNPLKLFCKPQISDKAQFLLEQKRKAVALLKTINKELA